MRKKIFLLLFPTAAALLLLLALSSCSGIIPPSEPDSPKASQTQGLSLRGTFDFRQTTAAPTQFNPGSRNAIPSALSTLSYSVTATRGSTTVNASVSSDNKSYAFNGTLTAGSWQITAYAKNGDTTVMQSEPKTVTLSSTTPAASTSLMLEPSSEGTGRINLTISGTVDSGIGFIKTECASEPKFSATGTSGSRSLTITDSNIPSGIYEVTISFFTDNSSTTPLYKCTEYVAIYPELTTDSWTVATAPHVTSSGSFSVTKSCVETFVYRKIYVVQDASTTDANGTSERPFPTIESAMARLNALVEKNILSISESMPWEVHFTGSFTASSIGGSGFINLPSGVGHLKIVGEGSGATINANTRGRVLNIPSGTNVTLENITLKSGSATNGGGINNAGNLTINEGVTIESNIATSNGGGIYNTGTLTMSAGEICGNTAAEGGGIYNTGNVFLYGSAVIGDISKDECATSLLYSNKATNTSGGGGGIKSMGGSVYLGYSDASHTAELTGGVCYNYSPDNGGIYVRESSLYIDSGTVSYNSIRGIYVGNASSSSNRAYVTMSGGTISENDSDSYGGGGIYVGGRGIFIMTGGSISSNTAATGGGVYIPNRSYSSFTMSGGDICGNTAIGDGGGVYIENNTFTMSNSSISGNSAVNGGGIYMKNCTVTIDGSSIVGREASGTEFPTSTTNASNKASGAGGGIYVESGTFNMEGSSKVSYNYADSGGHGIYIAGGSVTIGTTSSGSATVCNNGSNAGIYLTGSSSTLNLYGTVKNHNLYDVSVNDGSTFNMANGAVAKNVYLAGNIKINITAPLTATPAAKINPPSYTVGYRVLLDNNSGNTIAANYGHFELGNSDYALGNDGLIYWSRSKAVQEIPYLSSDASITIAGDISNFSGLQTALTAHQESNPSVKITLDLSKTSITSIGQTGDNYATGAFHDCKTLKEVILPGTVQNIYGGAFYQCTGLETITIPGSVEKIYDEAFLGCSGLTSLTLEDGIKKLGGQRAFYECISLTSVTIPNSVTDIGLGTFWRCTGLTTLTLPQSIASIPCASFYGCTSLSSITMPNDLQTIGEGAFQNCTSLNSITIPASVTQLKVTATYPGPFEGCANLTSATFSSPSGWTDSDGNAVTGLNNTTTAAEYLKSQTKSITRN
ncbi:MAG: leucine-rich repeat protein [Treponema sp.]|nr:leucine-rich repeat protein [Treponema sp.]